MSDKNPFGNNEDGFNDYFGGSSYTFGGQGSPMFPGAAELRPGASALWPRGVARFGADGAPPGAAPALPDFGGIGWGQHGAFGGPSYNTFGGPSYGAFGGQNDGAEEQVAQVFGYSSAQQFGAEVPDAAALVQMFRQNPDAFAAYIRQGQQLGALRRQNAALMAGQRRGQIHIQPRHSHDPDAPGIGTVNIPFSSSVAVVHGTSVVITGTPGRDCIPLRFVVNSTPLLGCTGFSISSPKAGDYPLDTGSGFGPADQYLPNSNVGFWEPVTLRANQTITATVRNDDAADHFFIAYVMCQKVKGPACEPHGQVG